MIDPAAKFAIAGAVTTGATALAAYATFAPGSGIWGSIVRHGSTDDPPRIALTFDDGPTPGGTDRILDLLGEQNVKAAFFVIGRNVERHPELLKRIDMEGHVIGNHTFDHSRWCTIARDGYWRGQIDQTDAAIARVIGRRPLFFRPPMGHKTPHTIWAARRNGQTMMGWSVRSWDGRPTTAEKIIRRVIPRCRAGSIVLLHDGVEPGRARDHAATIAAVRPLITLLREGGLEPVRLDQLTGLKPYAAEHRPAEGALWNGT